MRVKQGQYFGIGDGSLYCKAYIVSGDIVKASVINGGWDFTLNMKTGEMSGEVVAQNVFITYNGYFPLNIDYNEGCEFIRKQLRRNILSRSIVSLYYRIINFKFTNPQWLRLKRAIKAFKKSWDNIDDDIPF